MRETSAIVYNVTGQTVEYRFMHGRPTSATFEVFRDYADDTATAEFSGTATLTSPTTSLTAVSGAGQSDPQKLNLASTSFVTGRRYLISEASVREWVDPIEIASGYIRVRHPLQNAYTTAATCASTTLTATIDPTWIALVTSLGDVADQNPDYRVKWTIVYSGATYIAYSYFDVVRSAVTHQVDASDIDDRAPGFLDSLPVEHRAEQGRPLIDAAWRSVLAKLASISIDVDSIRDDALLDELVVMKACQILAMGGWRPAGYASTADYIEVTTNAFDRFLEQHLMVGLKHKLATGTGGGADVVRSQDYWRR